jgi:hypothetical protein
MRIKEALLFTVLLLAIVGCAGPVLVNESPQPIHALAYAEPGDAYRSYFQPLGKLKVTVNWDSGMVSVSPDQKATMFPDFDKVFTVHYRRAPLSDDQITITTDGDGLLKQVATTASDKTTDLVTGINSILTQSAAAIEAMQKANQAQVALPTCGKASTDIYIELTRPHSDTYPANAGICSATITAHVVPKSVLAVAMNSAARQQPIDCRDVVCFRLMQGYEITLKTTRGGLPPIDVVAPARQAYGFIKLDRHSFVENTVQADFTGGMLTGYMAKNPSAVIGFAKLPVEVLKSVPILVKF